ncbi:hypothetical protein ACHAPJ_013178 [Fusarium lateritium]
MEFSERLRLSAESRILAKPKIPGELQAPVKSSDGFVSINALNVLFSEHDLPQVLSAKQRKVIKTLGSQDQKWVAILLLAKLDAHIPHFLNWAHTNRSTERILSDDITLEFFTTLFNKLGVEGKELEKFEEWRWAIPPILRKDPHLKLEAKTKLPWLKKEKADNGSYGFVSKVQVAQGHLESEWSKTPFFALKEIDIQNDHEEKTAMNEVDVLRRRQHPNLVRLVASFTHEVIEPDYCGKVVNILFPYMEMDMEKWLYLSETPRAFQSLSTTQRKEKLYEMTTGLVSGLVALHKTVDGKATSHHDIKPKNVLVDGDRFYIADLGKAEMLSPHDLIGSGGGVNNGIGTYAYQPPEYGERNIRDDEARTFGRAFDVWATGCLIIQIATLMVHGWERECMAEFRYRRTSPMVKTPDSFANNIRVINDWFDRLQLTDGNKLVQQVLTVAVQMLRTDPQNRILSWEAELDLREFCCYEERELIDMTKGLVETPSRKQQEDGFETPLHRAVKAGNVLRTCHLLCKGWLPNQRDNLGVTPLEMAIQSDNFYLKNVLEAAVEHRGRLGLLHITHPITLINEVERNKLGVGTGLNLSRYSFSVEPTLRARNEDD